MARKAPAGFKPRPFVPSPESGRKAASAPSPADADGAAGQDPFAERPEVYVGAAFAGGLALATLFRLLGR